MVFLDYVVNNTAKTPSIGYVCLDAKAKEIQEVYQNHIDYLPQIFGYYPAYRTYKFICYITSICHLGDTL